MTKRTVYADNAATMPVSKKALDAAMPYLTELYGNAGAVYSLGTKSARAVFDARKSIARSLGCEASEIIFTSGGSESDNMAILGAAELGRQTGKRHIVTTNIEHHAVLNTCRRLEAQGYDVTYLPADGEGLIAAEQISEAIREDTALVSVMYANNEIGTLMPIKEIAAICRSKNILFHTDAVQAAGHLPLELNSLGVDMLSVSGHKFGAFKGVGALYIRKELKLPPLISGGHQESGLRAGTENVAGIVSMAEALRESLEGLKDKTDRLLKVRDKLTEGLLKIPGSRLNGDRKKRLPSNVNISFDGVEGESLLLMLDINGVMASSGSACTSYSADPSHVLKAIGLDDRLAKGSLRLSLSPDTTLDDAGFIILAVEKSVRTLRELSGAR